MSVLYDSITCPYCGNKGCEISNPSMPTVYRCPRCKYDWNPDNIHPIDIGTGGVDFELQLDNSAPPPGLVTVGGHLFKFYDYSDGGWAAEGEPCPLTALYKLYTHPIKGWEKEIRQAALPVVPDRIFENTPHCKKWGLLRNGTTVVKYINGSSDNVAIWNSPTVEKLPE